MNAGRYTHMKFGQLLRLACALSSVTHELTSMSNVSATSRRSHFAVYQFEVLHFQMQTLPRLESLVLWWSIWFELPNQTIGNSALLLVDGVQQTWGHGNKAEFQVNVCATVRKTH
jgi:hypothetical protein